MNWQEGRRDPNEHPNALDWASFYVEDLKYGPEAAKVTTVDPPQIAAQLEVLLRDAGIGSMTGTELESAVVYYAQSWADAVQLNRTMTLSVFIDGLMHGIAIAGGLRGTHPSSPSRHE
jgi:hypothetical protein